MLAPTTIDWLLELPQEEALQRHFDDHHETLLVRLMLLLSLAFAMASPILLGNGLKLASALAAANAAALWGLRRWFKRRARVVAVRTRLIVLLLVESAITAALGLPEGAGIRVAGFTLPWIILRSGVRHRTGDRAGRDPRVLLFAGAASHPLADPRVHRAVAARARAQPGTLPHARLLADSAPGRSAAAIRDRLLDDVRAFQGPAEQRDDLTWS